MTPKALWDQYTPEKRAVVEHFFHWQDIRTDTTYPDIECVLFIDIDRGIDAWNEFNSALQVWFPKLKTLLLSQNYSWRGTDADAAFLEFFFDPWIEQIWMEDVQSGYDSFDTKQVLPKQHIRVFQKEPSIDTLYIRPWVDKDTDTISYILIERGILQHDI